MAIETAAVIPSCSPIPLDVGLSDALTNVESAAALRVTTRTLARWREIGRGPKFIVMPSGEVFYRKVEIDLWLNSLTATKVQPKPQPVQLQRAPGKRVRTAVGFRQRNQRVLGKRGKQQGQSERKQRVLGKRGRR